MQIMPRTAAGVGADYRKLDDPVYNTSAGHKVYKQAGGFGPWVAAGRGGDYRNKPVYGEGGVIPGRPGEAKLAYAHAGERIISRRQSSAVERLANSVELWSARGAPGSRRSEVASVRVDNERSGMEEQGRLLRKQNALLEEQNSLLREVPERTGAAVGRRTQKQVDDTITGLPRGRR